MDLKELSQLINKPSLLAKLDKKELDNLISKYPWFSTAHLLRAKHAQLHANSELENILSTTAVFANNRQALFELMYPSVPEQIVSVETQENIIPPSNGKSKIHSEKNSAKEVEKNELEAEVIQSSISETVLQVEENSSSEKTEGGDHEEEGIIAVEQSAEKSIAENLTDEFEAMSNSGSAAEFIQSEIEENSDEPEVEITDTEISAVKILEDEIVRSEVDEMLKDNEIELLSSSEITHRFDEEETDEEGTAEEKFDSEIESNKVLEAQGSEIRLPQEITSYEGESHSFLDWLKQVNPSEISISKPVVKKQEVRKEKQLTKKEETAFSYPAEIIQKEKPKEEIVPLEYSHDLLFSQNEEDIKAIDNFVANLKHKPAQQTSTAQERAEKSLLEENEFVTETLAKILVKQEKFEKAISMYEKLSLKYPDKSLLFAALIKELKKKI